MKTNTNRILLLVALTGLVVAGCRPESPAAATAPPGHAVATPLAIATIDIGSRQTERGRQEARPLTTRDPIVVAVGTKGRANGAVLEAKLLNLGNGQVAGLQSRKISAAASAANEFTFENEAGWAAGRYLLELKLDGKLAGQRDVEIVDAPPRPAQQ